MDRGRKWINRDKWDVINQIRTGAHRGRKWINRDKWDVINQIRTETGFRPLVEGAYRLRRGKVFYEEVADSFSAMQFVDSCDGGMWRRGRK